MALVLFDTNILIDHFGGINEATEELLAYDDAVISAINWMETACTMTEMQKIAFSELLRDADIRVQHTNEEIMRRATTLRANSLATKPKKYMSDIIIRATAEAEGRIIITRNPQDFGGVGPFVRVPYKVTNGVVTDVLPPPK